MSTFDTANVENKPGQSGQSLTNAQTVTYAGSIGANPSANAIDIWGNIQLAATFIGYLNYPGTTHVLSWSTNGQTISTSSNAGQNLATIGALSGYTIVYSGAITGTAGVTVAGSATSLGPFNGGGIVTLINGAQSATELWTIQNGATLNYGAPGTWTLAQTVPLNIAIQSGGVVNVSMTNWASNAQNIATTINAGGVLNINGNAGNGNTGYLYKPTGNGTINGTINLSNALLQPASGYFLSGSGTVNVPVGSGVYAPVYAMTGIIYNIAGTGVGVTGQPDAALQFGNNLTVSSNINLTADATIGALNPFTYTGTLTIPSANTLTLGNSFSGLTAANQYIFSGNTSSATAVGTVSLYAGLLELTNSAGNYMPSATLSIPVSTATYQQFVLTTPQTLVSINNANATSTATKGGVSLNSTLTLSNQNSANNSTLFGGTGGLNITGGDLETTAVNTLTGTTTVSNGAAIGAGNTTTAKVGPLTMSSGGALNVNAISTSSASKLSCTTFSAAPLGWAVNVNGAMNAGTYPILVQTGTTYSLPSLGTNTSGRTVSFAWNTTTKTLNMTLV